VSSPKLKSATTKQLVARFRDVALAQFETHFLDEAWDEYNRLYAELLEIEAELKSRPGDQRRALTTLYNDENSEVRLKAAFATLAVEPEGSWKVLERLDKWDVPPPAALARRMMRAIKDGTYKPT
jgi:hypothetical protein